MMSKLSLSVRGHNQPQFISHETTDGGEKLNYRDACERSWMKKQKIYIRGPEGLQYIFYAYNTDQCTDVIDMYRLLTGDTDPTLYMVVNGISLPAEADLDAWTEGASYAEIRRESSISRAVLITGNCLCGHRYCYCKAPGAIVLPGAAYLRVFRGDNYADLPVDKLGFDRFYVMYALRFSMLWLSESYEPMGFPPIPFMLDAPKIQLYDITHELEVLKALEFDLDRAMYTNIIGPLMVTLEKSMERPVVTDYDKFTRPDQFTLYQELTPVADFHLSDIVEEMEVDDKIEFGLESVTDIADEVDDKIEFELEPVTDIADDVDEDSVDTDDDSEFLRMYEREHYKLEVSGVIGGNRVLNCYFCLGCEKCGAIDTVLDDGLCSECWFLTPEDKEMLERSTCWFDTSKCFKIHNAVQYSHGYMWFNSWPEMELFRKVARKAHIIEHQCSFNCGNSIFCSCGECSCVCGECRASGVEVATIVADIKDGASVVDPVVHTATIFDYPHEIETSTSKSSFQVALAALGYISVDEDVLTKLNLIETDLGVETSISIPSDTSPSFSLLPYTYATLFDLRIAIVSPVGLTMIVNPNACVTVYIIRLEVGFAAYHCNYIPPVYPFTYGKAGVFIRTIASFGMRDKKCTAADGDKIWSIIMMIERKYGIADPIPISGKGGCDLVLDYTTHIVKATLDVEINTPCIEKIVEKADHSVAVIVMWNLYDDGLPIKSEYIQWPEGSTKGGDIHRGNFRSFRGVVIPIDQVCPNSTNAMSFYDSSSYDSGLTYSTRHLVYPKKKVNIVDRVFFKATHPENGAFRVMFDNYIVKIDSDRLLPDQLCEVIGPVEDRYYRLLNSGLYISFHAASRFNSLFAFNNMQLTRVSGGWTIYGTRIPSLCYKFDEYRLHVSRMAEIMKCRLNVFYNTLILKLDSYIAYSVYGDDWYNNDFILKVGGLIYWYRGKSLRFYSAVTRKTDYWDDISLIAKDETLQVQVDQRMIYKTGF